MTKRQLPRKPITDEELSKGASYFGPNDLQRIKMALPEIADGDGGSFRQELEHLADEYVCLSHGIAKSSVAPSTEARQWASIRKTLDKFFKAIRDLPPEAHSGLLYSAEKKAKADQSLPDFEAETVQIEPVPKAPNSGGQISIWPVEKQIEKSFASLEWLREVIALAEDTAISEKSETGGNREDSARSLFLRQLGAALTNHFPDVRVTAWTNRDSDEAEGPLADILKAVFKPLGINASRETLVRAFRRANGHGT